MKCWDTLRGTDPTEELITFYKLDFGRQGLRQIFLIVNDVLEKTKMFNKTISNERQVYTKAMETQMKISEPTTVQNFELYKELFEQKFTPIDRSHRQNSGKFWFDWIFRSMIRFKFGDDVATTVHAYFSHIYKLDRGSHITLPTLSNHLSHFSMVSDQLRSPQEVEEGRRLTFHEGKMVDIFKACLDEGGELAHWKRHRHR